MEAFIIDPAKLIGDIVGEYALTLKTTQQMLRDPKKTLWQWFNDRNHTLTLLLYLNTR